MINFCILQEIICGCKLDWETKSKLTFFSSLVASTIKTVLLAIISDDQAIFFYQGSHW